MWHMAENMSWWMIAGWFWTIGVWGLVIWTVAMMIGRRSGVQNEHARQSGPDANRMLDQRYAFGEIDDEAYVRRRNHHNQTPGG